MAMGWAYRRASAIIALDYDMKQLLCARYGVAADVVPPWPSRVWNLPRAQTQAEWIWLYSGNLGRAHEWQCLLEAQRVLESDGLDVRLVFQGSGAAWDEARACAVRLGLQQCEWRPPAREGLLLESLMTAQVLAVTQRPETVGMLFPSKLVLASMLEQAVVWVGDCYHGAARMVCALPKGAVFAPKQWDSLARHIAGLRRGVHAPSSPDLARIAHVRAEGMDAMAKVIHNAYQEMRDDSFCSQVKH
jgi:hypothetical protein